MPGQAASKETAALLSTLAGVRSHVLGALESLTDEALRRPVLPSGWTCLGLVRHLALDDERFWFRAVIAGETVDLESGANAWRVPPDVPPEDVFDLYRREIDLANSIIAATPLDAAPARWPAEQFGDWRLNDVREIILHVITETAIHAGHIDAVVELIDGRQWAVIG